MTRTLVFVAALAVTLSLFFPQNAPASKPLATQEGVSCSTCHDKPGSKLLTDQGKYFEHRRTFEGYAEIRDTFGKCTACHTKKPGSEKLTRTGRSFAELVKDMQGLARYCEDFHSGLEGPGSESPASPKPESDPPRE